MILKNKRRKRIAHQINNLTPMMKQYLEIKKDYQDTILFYRMGDFYEMFYDDAKSASRMLGITLTTRDKGKPDPIPMCGVPCHSASSYISRLIREGIKVAICEQGPASSGTKGLMPREVVRVITPGLVLEDDHLIRDKANYLMAVSCESGQDAFGIAFADISTGDFRVAQLRSRQDCINEVQRVSPSEIITSDTDIVPEGFFITRLNAAIPVDRARDIVSSHFKTIGVEGLGLKGRDAALIASAMVIDYVKERLKDVLANITSLRFYNTGRYMILGQNTKRNLELFESISGDESATLYRIMNNAGTSMGSRRLADWISFPLMDPDEINLRLDAVESLVQRGDDLTDIRRQLKDVPDMERIVGRISAGSASPRDMVSLAGGLERVPAIKSHIKADGPGMLVSLDQGLDPLTEIREKIETTIVDEPPNKLTDGGVIADGIDNDLDELRALRKDSRQWIASLESGEREATGINNLKIGYNRVFGYYIEISKANADKAPESYIRKQTLTNAERFITPELKEYEARLLGAEDAIIRIETRIFSQLRGFLVDYITRIKLTIDSLACLDVLACLAWTAVHNGYNRPVITDGRAIEVRRGRHPVVEKVLRPGEFVPNSCIFNPDKDTLHIITGPNMAGKSTFMRQIALTTIMAQMGSFVPADNVVLGVADRIFTRIGALDNLSAGQSTFLVEMSETADILNNTTDKSIIILDEIGRGTSTYDGMSLAWAVAEYLDEKRARTFFATHYHELSDLARRHKGIKNFHMAIEESGHEVVFLRELRRGAIGRSFGIYVARLAGIPESVINNARTILMNIGKKAKTVSSVQADVPVQTSLFSDQAAQPEIVQEIMRLDMEKMRPIDALNILYKIREKAAKSD